MKSGIRVAVAGLAALAAGLLTSVTATAQAATPTYTTISKQSAADPGFSKFGSSYYVYATGGGDGILPIFRGSSLTKGFAKVGNAYTSAPAGLNNLWAPHVVARDGRFFMFFTAAKGSAPHCVYWAVASSPAGLFSTPHLATCGNAAGWEAIDPTVYETSSGVSYLVWKRGQYHPGFPDGTFQIRARKLTFSGSSVTFTGGNNPSLILAQIPDGTVMEAPSLVAHGGKVWLFVSRGRFDTNAYHTDAWVAKGFGPGFTYSNHVMATGQGYGYGPGGAEVITDTGGTVRIAYHVWETSKPTPSTKGTRIVRVATVTWPGGKPHVS
jgi:beta-xylosidase